MEEVAQETGSKFMNLHEIFKKAKQTKNFAQIKSFPLTPERAWDLTMKTMSTGEGQKP